MASPNDDELRVVLSDEYDPATNEPVTTWIVRLVAIADDTEVTDLPPLAHSVNTDAVDGLVNPGSIEDPETWIELAFRYEGYRVEIEANGKISLLVEDD